MHFSIYIICLRRKIKISDVSFDKESLKRSQFFLSPTNLIIEKFALHLTEDILYTYCLGIIILKKQQKRKEDIDFKREGDFNPNPINE